MHCQPFLIGTTFKLLWTALTIATTFYMLLTSEARYNLLAINSTSPDQVTFMTTGVKGLKAENANGTRSVR